MHLPKIDNPTELNSPRRTLINTAIWITPVLVSINLPSHAQASAPAEPVVPVEPDTCELESGSMDYTSPGDHQFTVPECVTSIEVSALGAGFAGPDGSTSVDDLIAGVFANVFL